MRKKERKETHVSQNEGVMWDRDIGWYSANLIQVTVLIRV